MFYVTYVFAELRRRKGRTLLTALGLAVGIGLVVTVSALSSGLDDAQAKVLEPLTGVGTDMSVTRPITITSSSNGSPFGGLSAKEREELQRENGGARFGLRSLGKPGSHFSRDSFVATSQLSFPATKVSAIRKLSGVTAASGGLTLNEIQVSGTVPKQQQQGGFGAPAPGSQGPRSINFNSMTVSGVDQHNRALGALTPSQVSKGSYFSSGSKRDAILDVGYARRNGLGIGDSVSIGGKKFTVVGIAKTPLGGQSSDVYVKLAQLQKLSDRSGRVNTVYVRATSSGNVPAVARSIRTSFTGSSVTTASDLAKRVSGSLVDAKNLASKLGLALEIVGLAAAVLIACLLTLSSVAKRVRELGTLKAVGWSQRLVVRQVTGETLVGGLLGGALGILLGVVGVVVINAIGLHLTAKVGSEAAAAPGPGPGVGGPFGQGAVASVSQSVTLTASLSIGLIVLAVALAVAGGLIAGAVGGLRVARLRPAVALRTIE